MAFYFVTFVIFAVVVVISILRIIHSHHQRKRQLARNGGLPVISSGRYGVNNDLPWVHSPSRGGIVYSAQRPSMAAAPVIRVDGRDESLPRYAPSLAYPPNVYTASSPHLAEAHRVQIQLYEQAQTQARIQALADNQARDQIGDLGGRRTLGVDDVEAVLRVPPPEYGKEPPKYA